MNTYWLMIGVEIPTLRIPLIFFDETFLDSLHLLPGPLFQVPEDVCDSHKVGMAKILNDMTVLWNRTRTVAEDIQALIPEYFLDSTRHTDSKLHSHLWLPELPSESMPFSISWTPHQNMTDSFLTQQYNWKRSQ